MNEQARLFAAVYDENYAAVMRFVERRAHPSHADDITAEVFLVAWRRIDHIPPNEQEARAWLYGVARNTLLSRARSQRRLDALSVRIADAIPAAAGDTTATAAAARVDLVRAWRQLSPTDQEALALATWEDLSAAQAAGVLGISAVAFRLRLSRARRALTRLMTDSEAAVQGPEPVEITK